MVELDSAGNGAGSVVRVDEYKRLHVGPDSAGAAVGICFKHDRLTVTDINVALGYVKTIPITFLAGRSSSIATPRSRPLNKRSPNHWGWTSTNGGRDNGVALPRASWSISSTPR